MLSKFFYLYIFAYFMCFALLPAMSRWHWRQGWFKVQSHLSL